MCGIAGYYGFRDDNLLKKFSKQLQHRGPDGEGTYTDDKVSLLSRRLAIIDRKGGDQPIFNEDGTKCVFQNGEIYNYRELTSVLTKKGHIFKTKSDTEMILHAYEEWGTNCFDKFNGMFAVAIYDLKKKELVLARDHFGIKPLYYAYVKDESAKFLSRLNSLRSDTKSRKNFTAPSSSFSKLMFSSEIKPIIESGLIKKRPNDQIIYRYLRYRVHDDCEETFFSGVYKLLPGQVMIIQNLEFRIQNYSNLQNDLLELSRHSGDEQSEESRIIGEFKSKLIEAVKLRLISEVPTGTCLSGGLDSSTVVAVVNRLLKEKVKEAESVGKIQKTFSAVFPGLANDEDRYVDQVVNKVNKVQSFKVKPQPEEFFEEIEDFVKTQEEPTISTGPYAQYKVMQEAHKYVTVVLDGQGSDEMMAGYLPYYFVYLRQLKKEKKYYALFREVFSSLDVIKRYLLTKKSINPLSVLSGDFSRKFQGEKFVVENSNLKKRLVEDIFKNSLPSLLRYEDKNSMRFSIEGRVPFLDINLLRYIFSLSDSAIIQRGWNKNILREAVANLLPEEIVKRRNKIGFTTPEYQWFMRMKNKIYGIFLSESFAKRKYFDQPKVLKLFEEFIQGKNDDTMLFWRMLNLELWMREFIDTGNKVYKVNKVMKKKEIQVEGKKYLRYPIRTELFKKGDDYEKKITTSVLDIFRHFDPDKKSGEKSSKSAALDSSVASLLRNDRSRWFVVVSEKVVAIAQGRAKFIWDIKPGFWANLLSKYVKKTPYGIGLGSPWTMQLAIDEVGLPKILFASFVSLVTKPFGLRGIFYHIAGETVAAIDGPTEYSLYPSNVSAKLGPKEPNKVAENIHSSIKFLSRLNLLRSDTKSRKNFTDSFISNFLGAVIIDANDLGQKVLGNSTGLDNKLIEKIFSDNPMGQSDEQTPVVLVFRS